MGNHKVISESWTGTGTAAPLVRGLNAIGRVINNVQGVGGIHAYIAGDRLVIEGGSAADFPWSNLCFGFTLAGATVTIKAGEIEWGVGAATPMADAGPIALTADYQYIGIQFDPSVPAVIALGPSADVAIFRRDAAIYRRWLFQFRLVQGKASLWRVGNMGNIDLAGWPA